MENRLLIIHGLNNKIEALTELGRSFQNQFELIYLKLPHHDDLLPLDFDFQKSLEQFQKDLTKHLNENTYILSYSLGCAYLQYLFEKGSLTIPMSRVIYLSPALKTKLKLSVFRFLPSHFPLPSFSPKQFRYRNFCYWGQYKMLFELSSQLKLQEYPLIFADPKDELINLDGLDYIPLKREYLPFGEHHLSFHPQYYKNNQWEKLIEEIKVRLLQEA